MNQGDVVTKRAELEERVGHIESALHYALFASRKMISQATFTVRTEIVGSVVWYQVTERRTFNNSIFGSTYAINGTRIDSITDSTGFANLITEIRRALEATFRTCVAPQPINLTTYTYTSTATTIPFANYQTYQPFAKNSGFAEIDLDAGALNSLLIATGKMKTYEQEEEERALESIKQSVLAL